MTTVFDEALHSIRASYGRSLDAISRAVEEGRDLTAEAASSNGRVVVEVKGNRGTVSVAISDEEFEERDPDGLADAVLSAYGNAVRRLRQEQRHTVLSSVFRIERHDS